MPPGTVTYVPAGANYTRHCKKDHVIAVHFEVYNYHSSDIQFFTAKNPEALQRQFEALAALWQQKERGFRHLCHAKFYELLATLQQEADRQIQQQGKSRLNQPALSYIHMHYTSSSLSVRQLAQSCHLSEAYFRRLFQQVCGISPKQYIIKLRMEYAVSLLQSHYFSIAEIAEKAGFSNEKYFSTLFKRVIGVSPSKYQYQAYHL